MWQLGAPLGLGFWPDALRVDVALTGAEVTVNEGTVTPVTTGTTQVALTGTEVGTALGALTLGRTAALAGAEVGTALGALTLGRTAVLAGAEVTSEAGTVTPFTTGLTQVALTGTEVSTGAGSVGVGDRTAALTGEEVTVATGTVSGEETVEIALAGAEVGTTVGGLVAARELALTGQSITVDVGALGFGPRVVAVTGDEVTSATGNVTAIVSSSDALPIWINGQQVSYGRINEKMIIGVFFNGEQVWP